MNILKRLQAILPVFVCGLLSWQTASAQSYIRYINPEDLVSRTLYADSVLTSIVMPRGVAKLFNYPKFNMAAYELAQVLQDPSKELLQVWVCGSTSPEGLWKDNVKLSHDRTEAAAAYLQSIAEIPSYKIRKQSLNEDWDRLAEMIASSDLPESYKYETLYIIRTLDWGERKTALQNLHGGVIWKILEKDFFPKLRCVRFAIFCKWDPTKPYMTAPVVAQPVKQEVKYVNVVPEATVAPVVVPVKDTIYVRDTVYIRQETVYVKEDKVMTPYQEYREQSLKSAGKTRKVKEVKPEIMGDRKYWDTPWMMGVKTNLIGDAMLIPTLGMEFQLSKRISLDIQGFYSKYNIFNLSDKDANVYGFSPELRFWGNGKNMQRGNFFGVHARVAWYTLQWKDGFLYQNGLEDDYGRNAGDMNPAWSVGLTYGYSMALDRKAHWGLELMLGVGYAQYSHNRAEFDQTRNTWSFYDHQNEYHVGITRAGINLTYRFSVRRVKPEYYQK